MADEGSARDAHTSHTGEGVLAQTRERDGRTLIERPVARLGSDDCERILHEMIAAGDARGVEAALMAMALRDPHRAQHLLDALKIGLVMADIGPVIVPPGEMI